MKDDLGTRMKEQYENRTRYFLPRRTYTIIRLDGKAFHTFTRGMKRPYDEDLMDIMDSTAKFLCEEIQGCKMAYTQSDEISLLLTDFENITTAAWFDGNIQKMASVAASMATAKFNQLMLINQFADTDLDIISHGEAGILSELEEQRLAFFDARVFTIPDPIEVENYFIWRQKDAVRNSISMTAQSFYSHKELNGKSQSDMHEMIFQKGQNWHDMPEGFKRGRTIYQEITKTMSADSFDQEVYTSKEWKLKCPDFLKERDKLSALIPKIIT